MARRRVTDQQVMDLLREGYTQTQIAHKCGVSQSAINARIKRFKRNGTYHTIFESNTGREFTPGLYKKMDTAVRKADRRWFRITAIDGNYADLRGLHYGEGDFTSGLPEIYTVHLATLETDYTKKSFPEVKCYNLSELLERDSAI